MAHDGITETMAAFAAAGTAGDIAGMRAFLSEEYFGHAPAAGEPSQADRWADLVPDVVAAMSDFRVGFEQVRRDGGLVHALATVRGTHTGGLWGSPPSAATVRLEFPVTLRNTGHGWAINVDVQPTAALGALREVGVVPPADQMHLPPRNPIRPPEFLLVLGFTGQAAAKPCSHLASARFFEPSTDVCHQCVDAGGFWPALRMCLACGFIGCCDTSVSKHMHQHYEATGHPLFRSIRLREGWIWCYEDAAFFERSTLERLAASSA